MNYPVSKHSDERRDLIEWVPDASIRACKVLVAKDDCTVGAHYHRKKHEWFYLLQGLGTVTLNDDTFQLVPGIGVLVRRGIMHSFFLEKGSILLGAASEPFDPEDDYK